MLTHSEKEMVDAQQLSMGLRWVMRTRVSGPAGRDRLQFSVFCKKEEFIYPNHDFRHPSPHPKLLSPVGVTLARVSQHMDVDLRQLHLSMEAESAPMVATKGRYPIWAVIPEVLRTLHDNVEHNFTIVDPCKSRRKTAARRPRDKRTLAYPSMR